MGVFTAASAALVLVGTAQAQYGGGNPYSGYSGSNNPYSSSSSGSSNGGSGYEGGTSFGSLNFSQATTLRIAHGVMASLAFVIFFPVGAISIRLLPGRLAFWMHVIFQVLAYLTFIAAFGIGVYLARMFTFGSFSLIHTYHPIIGIVVFAFILIQPILGYIHHVAFKKHARRTVWSYAHIWLGRIVITIGIINGGLGLRLANNTRSGEIAYGVVAGIIWLIWMAAAVYGEIKKHRLGKQGKPGSNELPPRYSSEHDRRRSRSAGGHESTRLHETRSQHNRRRSGSRSGGARPSQTPLMSENTAYGGGARESMNRRGSQPVREYYAGNGRNERQRSWV